MVSTTSVWSSPAAFWLSASSATPASSLAASAGVCAAATRFFVLLCLPIVRIGRLVKFVRARVKALPKLYARLDKDCTCTSNNDLCSMHRVPKRSSHPYIYIYVYIAQTAIALRGSYLFRNILCCCFVV